MSSFSVSIGQVFDAAESPIEQDVICELGKWGAAFVKCRFDQFDEAIAEVAARGGTPIVVAGQVNVGKYRVDLLLGRNGCSKKVVVECDGHDFHHVHQWQAERDAARDADLATRGLIVERLSGSDIFNHLTWKLAKILQRNSFNDEWLQQIYFCQECVRAGHCPRGSSTGCKPFYSRYVERAEPVAPRRVVVRERRVVGPDPRRNMRDRYNRGLSWRKDND